MDDKMRSEPNETVRAEYNAPRAERLSDAARVCGSNVCTGDGSGAGPGCDHGGNATSCKTYGNTAGEGCETGGVAFECKDGNGAL
jgi:hypothetical protein